MKVFGLFGEKLSHSLSPTIHNKLYYAMGIDAAYSLFEIKQGDLYDAIKGVRALNINGVNVTIPYKLKVMEFLDNISDEALRIGAVNTIYNKMGQLNGYNTDFIGFGRMLKKHSIDVQQKRAVVLGTGGAAKSVVTFLEDNGISDIYLVSREPEGVKTFDSSKYQLIDYNRLTNISQADILVNCTPCGMHPKVECSPIDESLILRFGAVVDLIYNPTETLLLKYARNYNIKAVNGLYMLVSQAAAAVEIWTGQTIENSIVENVYDEIRLIFEK